MTEKAVRADDTRTGTAAADTAPTAYDYTVGAHDSAPKTSSTSASSSFVYDDALRWDNWSWNTALDPNAAVPSAGGAKSLGITFTAGYAGAFFAKTGFDTTPYTHLSFKIHPDGASLPALRVYLVDSAGTNLTFVDPSAYATASSGGWYSVTIPLSALSGTAKPLAGVVFHEFSGAAQPTFYMSNLAFKGTPPSTSATGPMPSSSFVYDDTLRWDNWSWNTTLDPNAAVPSAGGAKSLSITFTAGYAGAFLAKTGFDTTPYTHLSFKIHPDGASLPALRVYLVDSTGANLTFVDPSAYATASSGGWYTVTIPLSALSGTAKPLTGVVLHEFSGAAQPTFYVANLAFESDPRLISLGATPARR